MKEAEVIHVRGLLSHAQNEAGVQRVMAQERYDELQARFFELEEKLEVYKDDARRVAEEHAEYEVIIHRNNGVTNSEAEAQVKELMSRWDEYGGRYGLSSWQFREQVAELNRVGSLYKIVAVRHPGLEQFLYFDAEPFLSAGASTSSTPIPRTEIVDRHSPEFYERERQWRVGRGRARGSSIRGRGSVRGRGRGRGRISIDSLLNSDFTDNWLSFSRRPSGPSSSS